jgi:hypothetical protein
MPLPLFQCPQCGYKNYIDEADLDRMRAERRDSLKEQADKTVAFGREHRDGFFRRLRQSLSLPPKDR